MPDHTDDDERVNVPHGQWSRFPVGPIFAGALCRCQLGDAEIYLAIAAHADRQMRATVGQRRIAELTGASKGRVVRGIRRLCQAGMISVTTPARGKRPATIELCQSEVSGNGQRHQTTLAPSSSEGAKRLAPSSSEGANNGRNLAPSSSEGASESLRPHSDSLAPSFLNLAPSPGEGETEEQNKQSRDGDSSQKNSVDNDAACLRKVLTEAGVGEPALSRLASENGLTPSAVERAAERAERRGLGPGALIKDLRRIAAEARRAERRAERDARSNGQHREATSEYVAELQSHGRAAQIEQEAADEVVAGLTPAEVSELSQRALAAMPECVRSVAERRGVEGSQLLRLAIARLAGLDSTSATR